MVKADPAEEASIAKDERPLRLPQNKVVVLFRPETGRLDPQFSGHAKVNADRVPAGELEQHLFSPGERPEQSAPGNLTNKRPQIGSAENAFAGVELNAQDFL